MGRLSGPARGGASARRRLSLILLLAGCGSDPAPAPLVLDSGRHRLEITPDGAAVSLHFGQKTLLRLDAAAFELGVVRALDPAASYDPYWLETDDPLLRPEPPEDLRFLAVGASRVESSSERSARIALDFGSGMSATVELSAAAPDAFTMRLLPAGTTAAVAYLRIRPVLDPSEGLYGLGEWPDAVDHRGRLRPMQLEPDLRVESANNEANVPIPLLIGTRGWGLFVKSRRVGLFDLQKDRQRAEITYGTAEQSAAGLEVHLFGAPEPFEALRHYYAVTAPPLLPAPWALGPWIWRDENRDQAEVEDDIRMIRDLDLATTAIWIDRPYATRVNTFDFDPLGYPDPAAMIGAAHRAGLRMALWHTPYLEPGAEPFRATALERGYFPPKSGTLLNNWSEPIDLTNPEAFAFWQDNLRRYIELGIEGFKLDYAQDVVPGISGGRNEWRFADGSDERTTHHEYTLLYHRAYAELLPARGGFLLCRAGRWGDQAFASVIWPGDMDANLVRHRERFTSRGGESVVGVGGLPATVIQGINLSASGYPFFGADTGGYRHSPPDRETWIRWVEQTALSTVMQVGDSSSQPPWVFTSTNGRDQAALDLYRSYARLHLRLFPYQWTLAQQIAATGRPIQRAIGLAYPEHDRHPDDQYLLGPDLLVAPVVDRGATSRRVWLPPGVWIDWWSGMAETGPGEITVSAPLELLPLFLRAGAVVPLLRPTIDTFSPAEDPGVESFSDDPGVLYARAAAGTPGAFELWDASRLEVQERAVLFQAGSLFQRGAIFELLGAARPSAVEVDGQPIPERASLVDLEAAPAAGWWHQGTTLWIRVASGRAEIR